MPKKYIRGLIYFFFSLAFSIYGIAQSDHIEGKVFENNTGKGLSNAYVLIKGSNTGTVTDQYGYFKIDNLRKGRYNLQVRCLGFEIRDLEITSSATDSTEIEIFVNESITMLKGASVESVSIIGGTHALSELPASAVYISPKQLEKYSYNDISRILRNVPGVNIQDEDGFGLRPNIGIRGTGSERSSKITLMEDGILIAPAPYVAPSAYYFPSAGRMQGIEVRKGASQVKYGPYTTGGAINLLSTSIPDNLFGRIHLFGGSYGKRDLHAFVGDASEKAGFLVETYQSGSNGFKELDNGGETGYRTEDYLLKLRINSSESARIYQSLSLKAGRYLEDANETYLGLTDEDFEVNPYFRYAASQMDHIKTDQSQIVLTHYIVPTSSMKINTSIYKTEFARNWYKLDKIKSSDSSNSISITNILQDPVAYRAEYEIINGSTSINNDALEVKANNRSYWARGIQTNLQNRFDGLSFEHILDYGLRYHQDQIDRFQWVDSYKMDDGNMQLTSSGVEGTESNRIERARATAGFIQYTLKNKRLIFTPGIRFEDILIARDDYGKNDPDRTGVELSSRENHIKVLIPGVGIDYKPGESIGLFAGIHRGFSPPGSKEGTLPESSVNYEFGSRIQHALFNFEITGFYNDYKNLLGADLASSGGTGSGDLFNGGSSLVYGSEISLEFGPKLSRVLSLPVDLSYTYTRAEFRTAFESEFEGWGSVKKGDELPYLAPHQLILNMSLEHPKFNVNLSSKYTSAMRAIAGSGTIDPNESTDEVIVLDLSGQYNLSWHLGFFASVYNLTNAVYIVSRRPAGVRPGLPRSLSMGVKANF